MNAEQNSDSVRKKIQEARKALSLAEVTRLSVQVVERFQGLFGLPQESLKGMRIGLYRPIRSELNLISLELALRKAGAHLHFPRITDQEKKEMDFVFVPEEQLDLAWQIGPYGVQEPHPELKAVNAEDLELILVPGLAFGMLGERIGMGAGYYDRFLPKASNALRIALIFDLQLLSRLEQNTWDQPVHWIVTEKREVKTPRVERWLKKKAVKAV